MALILVLTGSVAMAQSKAVKVGVMLPLNNNSDNGRDMVEYYRGILMACDSLRQEGTSVSIRAWNVEEKSDIDSILIQETPEDLDLIIGPLYSKHVGKVADFAKRKDIKMMLPFAVKSGNGLSAVQGAYAANDAVYQCFMSDEEFNSNVVDKYVSLFDTCHTVIIDCMDPTSTKAAFMKRLRKGLDENKHPYSITSVKSAEEDFQNAFKRERTNVVVLNTARSQDLNIICAKLNSLKVLLNDTVNIRLFGHPEWLGYTSQNLTNFYAYDTFIPSTYYMNPLSPRTARMNLKYRWNFHADMIDVLPRFATTGYDHAYFYIKGLRMYGKGFSGRNTAVGYDAIQTPLNFEKTDAGYYRNKSIMLIHYTPTFEIETYTY